MHISSENCLFGLKLINILPKRPPQHRIEGIQGKFAFFQKVRREYKLLSRTSKATADPRCLLHTYMCALRNIFKARICCSSLLQNPSIHNPTACFKTSNTAFCSIHHSTSTTKTRPICLLCGFNCKHGTNTKLDICLWHSLYHLQPTNRPKDQQKQRNGL